MQLTISQRQKQTQQPHLSHQQRQINELHQNFSYRQIEAMLLANPLIECEEVYNDIPEQPFQYETEDENQYDAELWESGVTREYESDESTNQYDDNGEPGNNNDNDEYDTTITEYDYNSSPDAGGVSAENNFLTYTAAPEPDFREELASEIKCLNPPLPPEFQAICIDIIHLLESNGFLPLSIEEVADQCNISAPEVQKAVAFIQDNLEPPGIAARDKYEYVLLNLKRQGKDIGIYEKLFTECRDIDNKKEIADKLDISQSKLEEIFDDLQKFKRILVLSSDDMNQFIDPVEEIVSFGYRDFRAYLTNSKWKLELFDYNKEKASVKTNVISIDKIPNDDIRNKLCAEIDEAYEEYAKIGKEKYEEAETLFNAYGQYREKLLQITNELIKVQRDFLIYGELARLKPCTQKAIAEKVGIDTSCISRIIQGEYIRTPWGEFPFQYFFQEGLTNEEGKQFTRAYVKKFLKKLIDKEDKTKPFSDEKLAELLQVELKIKCSREVVTKYREELKIGNSRERKTDGF